MSKRSCTEEMFLKDVAEHQMTVLLADNKNLFEKVNTDDNHIKTLAQAYLTKKERSATV